MYPAFDTLVTVKTTLARDFLSPVLDTVHTPLELVVQVDVPVAPALHVPVTVAPPTTTRLPSSTTIVTVAFQAFV